MTAMARQSRVVITLGPNAEIWRCVRCGGRLGTVLGDRVEIKHEGRTIKAGLPCDQMCDRCQTFNRRDIDEPSPT